MRKRTFTLLEVVICLALIALVGGIFALNGASLLRQSHFEKEIGTLKEELRLTKSLARSLQSDITLHLEMRGDGLYLFRESDEPVSESLRALCFKKKIHFPHLKISEDQKFNFTGTGIIVPSGRLVIFSPSQSQTYDIDIDYRSDFRGYFKDII